MKMKIEDNIDMDGQKLSWLRHHQTWTEIQDFGSHREVADNIYLYAWYFKKTEAKYLINLSKRKKLFFTWKLWKIKPILNKKNCIKYHVSFIKPLSNISVH